MGYVIMLFVCVMSALIISIVIGFVTCYLVETLNNKYTITTRLSDDVRYKITNTKKVHKPKVSSTLTYAHKKPKKKLNKIESDYNSVNSYYDDY